MAALAPIAGLRYEKSAVHDNCRQFSGPDTKEYQPVLEFRFSYKTFVRLLQFVAVWVE
jgi:hypothetical protein